MLPRTVTPPPDVLSAIRTQSRTRGLVLTPSSSLRYCRPHAASRLRGFSSRKSPACPGLRTYFWHGSSRAVPEKHGQYQINGKLFTTSSRDLTTTGLQPYSRTRGSLAILSSPSDQKDSSPAVQSNRTFATASTPPKMYTTSFAFFEALWEAGVTHCFVNLGSDHPSIIEAMVKGQREAQGKFPRIITCPNEVSPSSLLAEICSNSCKRWWQCLRPTVLPA